MKRFFALATVAILAICMLTSCGEVGTETEANTHVTLTVENSQEFAEAIKASEEDAYDVFIQFLSNHEYDFIEFDGTVVKWGPPVPSAKGLYMHVAIEDSYATLYKNGVTWKELPVTDGVEGLNVGAKVHIRGLIVDEDIEIKSIVITVPSEIIEETTTSNRDEQSDTDKDTLDTQTSTNSSMVWIPQTGSKYHSSKYCSDMENPSQITKERAEALGYTACKKCH